MLSWRYFGFGLVFCMFFFVPFLDSSGTSHAEGAWKKQSATGGPYSVNTVNTGIWTSPGLVDTPQPVAEARSNASGLMSPTWL